jgi:uncharacterized membrane protein
MASSKPRTGRRPDPRPSTAGIPLATPNRPARPPKAREAAEPAEAGLTDDELDEFDEEETGPARSGPPPWLQWTTLLLALVGLGISIYETYAHYTSNHLFGCAANSHSAINCTAVITSPQAMVFNIFPVAVLGLAFYVFAVAIFSPWAWRSRRREVHWLRLASMVVGIGFVLYLVYAELAQIGSICEYCTGVHIVTFVLFCITVMSAALWGLRGAGEEIS